jgi:hypothetical protein
MHPSPAGSVVCRNTAVAQVLCALLFEDGTRETAPAATRTARLRLVKCGRTFATGKTVVRSGTIRLRLTTARTVRLRSYRLRSRVAGETVSRKVRLRASRPRL